MTFQKYQSANNAQGVLHMPISSSATSMQLESGQGDRFSSTFPYLLTLEQLDALMAVIKREIVKVTNKVGDVLTIVRSSGTCLPDDTSTTQGTQAFSFDADITRVMNYIHSEQINDIQTETARLETDKLDIDQYQAGTYVYGASSGGSDDYIITLSVSPGAYIVGQNFKFLADIANSGSATLNINGLGAKTIKKNHDQDLETGDIEAGQIVIVAYDGTNFQMNSQSAIIPTAETAILIQSFIAGENISATDSVYINSSDGKVYKTDADDSTKCGFIGFAQETKTTDQTIKIQIQGICTGFTGKTIGATQFLSGTAGAIAETAGTFRIEVGIAVSADKVLINVPIHSKTFIISRNMETAAGTVQYTHNLGFVPRKVTIQFASSTAVGSRGSYAGGSQSCVSPGMSSNHNFTDRIINLGSSSTINQYGVIQNLTKTTFDIVWYKPGSTAVVYYAVVVVES